MDASRKQLARTNDLESIWRQKGQGHPGKAFRGGQRMTYLGEHDGDVVGALGVEEVGGGRPLLLLLLRRRRLLLLLLREELLELRESPIVLHRIHKSLPNNDIQMLVQVIVFCIVFSQCTRGTEVSYSRL